MCYTILSSELLFGAKMLVKKKLIKKIAIKTVSILVVISLVLTGVNDLSFAIPVPFNMVPAQARISSVNTNIIPFNVGRVTETIYNGSGKTLLLIQDLHAHRQTQENINSILKILDKKYGIKNIWLEGASGQLDTSWLSSIKDKTSKEKIIQFLLEKGRLTGAELFSIQVNRPEILKGIENREVYLTNFDRLKEIYNKKSEIESYLPKIKAILDAKTKKYFSRENRKMIVLYEKNLSEKIKVEKYFKAVLKASKKAGIDLNKYEQIAKYLYVMDKHKNLKLNKARKQTKEILVELKTLLPYQQYKSLVDKLNNKETEFEFYTDINKLAEENGLLGKYEDAKKLFEYLTYRELLNPIEFAEQEAELINEIEMRFARTGYEKEIVFLRKYFGLLESYLKNKITADEYKYFENNKERFKTTWTKYVDIDEIIDINKYFDLFDDFYKDNLERNRYFIENITGVKPAAEQDAIIIKGSDQYNIKVLEELGKEKDGIEVVIAGGFHTRGLSRLFEEEKINYIVITPNVIDETVTSERLYENMFTEEYAILKEKFANIPTTALVKEIIRRLGDIEEVRLNAKGLIELVTAKETIMLGQNGSINDNIAETSARDIKLSQEQEKIVAEAFLSLQEYLKKQRENVRKQKSGEPAEDISVLKERTEKLINNIEDNSLREEFLQAESNKTFKQPKIIGRLKNRGIENKELFNFLVKFRENKYIGLVNNGLLKGKDPIETFEQGLEGEYEQILNEEDFYITYGKAEKIYEEEMPLLRATDRAEYERISSFIGKPAIEEFKNYINNRKSATLKQWKEMLREDKYTNAERVLIARGIRQYLRKAKTSAIPVEYIETAFDKFIENFKNTQIEEAGQFNIYEQYLKCITEQITAEGNNPIVKEVSYNYNGTEIKGKWIRIKGEKSIDAEGKGDLELNKQILSAVSSEEWCTRGRGGEETVLEGHGSDFYVFIEDGQIRSTLGFVPAEDLEDLKTDPWYYGLFEQGNGQNNIVPEIYDEAVKKLQKELESGKYRDEDGYKTLQEIGYPDIINKKREKREKQKEFFEKTRDVTDYTDETIRQMFVEAFSVVITQDEYGNWNTVHEVTDSMLDEMAEIDISIVEKFLKTIKNVELSASILNVNYAKYVGDLNVGQDLKLGVRYLKKGVRLKAGGDLDLGELTEIAEEVSLESNGELYLRNLTKIGNKAILKNGKDINLYLAGVTELGEGVTLKAGGELILLNIFKIGENVSLEAGTTLYLNRLTTLPKNTDNMELYFKWVSCSNNEIEKQLIEIRNRTERKPIEKSVLSAIVKNVNYWLQFKFFEKISTNLMLNIIKLFMEETNIVSIVDIDDIERIQEAEELAKNGTKVNMVLLRAKDEEFVTKKETGKVLGNENVGYYRELSTQRGNLTEYEYERTDGDFSSEEKILELLLEDIKNGNNIGKKNKNVLYVSPSLVKRSKSMLEKYIKDNTILSLSNESIKGALIKGLLNSHRNARVEVLSNMVMVPENIYGTYKLHEFKEEDIVALKDKGIQTIMFDITPAGMVGDKLNLTEKDFGVERQKENVYKAINIAKEHGMNVIIYGEGAENINIEDVTVAVFENPTDRQMQVMDYNKAIESKENLSNVIVTIARNERENIVITPEQIKRIINTGAAIAFDGEVLTEVSKESTSENGISMFEIIKAMFAETPKQKAEREEFEGIIDGREIALKELENIKKYSMEEIGIKDLYYFEEFIKNEDLGEKSLSDLYNKAQSFLENILIGRKISLEELHEKIVLKTRNIDPKRTKHKGNPEPIGVGQLIHHIDSIDADTFQWDANIPDDVAYYPLLVFEDVKLVQTGILSIVNRWFYEEIMRDKKLGIELSDAYMPVMVVSINTLYLYDKMLHKRGLTNVIDSFVMENAVYDKQTGMYRFQEVADFDGYLRSYPFRKVGDAVKWTTEMIKNRNNNVLN